MPGICPTGERKLRPSGLDKQSAPSDGEIVSQSDVVPGPEE